MLVNERSSKIHTVSKKRDKRVHLKIKSVWGLCQEKIHNYMVSKNLSLYLSVSLSVYLSVGNELCLQLFQDRLYRMGLQNFSGTNTMAEFGYRIIHRLITPSVIKLVKKFRVYWIILY